MKVSIFREDECATHYTDCTAFTYDLITGNWQIFNKNGVPEKIMDNLKIQKIVIEDINYIGNNPFAQVGLSYSFDATVYAPFFNLVIEYDEEYNPTLKYYLAEEEEWIEDLWLKKEKKVIEDGED